MRSATQTMPLVELYVSERCADCSRAERWLTGLASERPGLVALLSRIDAADYGAAKRREPRGGRLTIRQRLALEHAPFVLLQGREAPHWEMAAFREELERLARRPAPVRLALRAAPAGAAVAVEADVDFLDEEIQAVVLYLAAYVLAQETTPVAYAWQGPFKLSKGSARLRQRLAPVPGRRPGQSGVAAFVQDARTGEGLQALTLPPCPG